MFFINKSYIDGGWVFAFIFIQGCFYLHVTYISTVFNRVLPCLSWVLQTYIAMCFGDTPKTAMVTSNEYLVLYTSNQQPCILTSMFQMMYLVLYTSNQQPCILTSMFQMSTWCCTHPANNHAYLHQCLKQTGLRIIKLCI